MRKSKEETARTRERIVAAAAQAFRTNGIDATAVTDVMAAAGLTHGGFYRHFASKDELVAEASMLGIKDQLSSSGGTNPATDRNLDEIIANYLSTRHRDDRAHGCPFSGLASELVRTSDGTRSNASAGFQTMLAVVEEHYRKEDPEGARNRAIVTLAGMIGSLTMSRIVTDEAFSEEILAATRDHLSVGI